METTERDWEKWRKEQKNRRRKTGRRQGRPVGAALAVREKRRLVQLLICILLFLTVFAGKGLFPERMQAVRASLTALLQRDMDFRETFISVGKSISQGRPALDTLGELWVDVFGSGQMEEKTASERGEMSAFWRQAEFLGGNPKQITPVEHWLGVVTESAEPEPENPPIEPEPEPSVSAQPAVEYVAYNGPALPENTSMDRYNLELLGVTETVTPAMGWVASEFGWREHPVDGGEKFHNGVDLAVNTGTDVLAFADGTVDYIGESPIYGEYLQLQHAGGVTTFYAHCSQLLVQQGQTVKAGERVALSGATGNVTGPHLHFELKLNGVRLNPLYYIQTT